MDINKEAKDKNSKAKVLYNEYVETQEKEQKELENNKNKVNEKSLIKVNDNSIFSRIKNFFKELFWKDTIIVDSEKNIIEKTNSNFKENIVIKQDEEKIRMLKLQKKIENNEVIVEKISNDDFEKLCNLYEKQINELDKSTEEYNKSTEIYKQKI